VVHDEDGVRRVLEELAVPPLAARLPLTKSPSRTYRELRRTRNVDEPDTFTLGELRVSTMREKGRLVSMRAEHLSRRSSTRKVWMSS
jgi:hypothetical protein